MKKRQITFLAHTFIIKCCVECLLLHTLDQVLNVEELQACFSLHVSSMQTLTFSCPSILAIEPNHSKILTTKSQTIVVIQINFNLLLLAKLIDITQSSISAVAASCRAASCTVKPCRAKSL